MPAFDHGFTLDLDGRTYRVNITREALEAIAADPAGVPSAVLFARNRDAVEGYARELIRTGEPLADGIYLLTDEWLDPDAEGLDLAGEP